MLFYLREVARRYINWYDSRKLKQNLNIISESFSDVYCIFDLECNDVKDNDVKENDVSDGKVGGSTDVLDYMRSHIILSKIKPGVVVSLKDPFGRWFDYEIKDKYSDMVHMLHCYRMGRLRIHE